MSSDMDLPDPEELEREMMAVHEAQRALSAGGRGDAQSGASRSKPSARGLGPLALTQSASLPRADFGASATAVRSGSTSQPSRKPKRAPSLLFRRSLAPNTVLGATGAANEAALRHIPLSDGRTLSFNPFGLDKDHVIEEIEASDLGAAEKQTVKDRVQEEVIKALTESVGKWNVV